MRGSDLMELYNSNADFRQYADKCCAGYSEGRSATLGHVLGCAIVREVAEMYLAGSRRQGPGSSYTPQGECV